MTDKYQDNHSPGAELDYGFDWTQWLESGETITASSWAVANGDTGITLNRGQIAGNITSTYVNGGEKDQDYTVINTVTTSVGRIDGRSLVIKCRTR